MTGFRYSWIQGLQEDPEILSVSTSGLCCLWWLCTWHCSQPSGKEFLLPCSPTAGLAGVEFRVLVCSALRPPPDHWGGGGLCLLHLTSPPSELGDRALGMAWGGRGAAPPERGGGRPTRGRAHAHQLRLCGPRGAAEGFRTGGGRIWLQKEELGAGDLRRCQGGRQGGASWDC